MIKNLVICLSVFLFFTSLAIAGGVTDDNNATNGQILVATGENHGKDTIGHWTDSSFLKGEKGDQGDVGPQGPQGIAGQDGLNGVDGINGLNGIDGAIGPQGEKGNMGDKGDEGKTGKQGEQGPQGLQGKGLKDRIELIGEVRILDTKKTTWSVYAGQDVNNRASIVGAKVVFKLGSSYEQRELEKLNARLDKLEGTKQEQERINNTETYLTPTGFGIRSKF